MSCSNDFLPSARKAGEGAESEISAPPGFGCALMPPSPKAGRERSVEAQESEKPSGFPWGRIMQLGLGQLRLAPKDFWSMTLRELDAALGLGASARTMTRDDLQLLLERYPDE